MTAAGPVRLRHGPIVCANLVFFLALAFPALAADASPWDGDARGAVRIIAAATTTEAGSAVPRAGVEVKLGSGWKTYWRYPGDSGVPPNFDFTGSKNVKIVTVLWPAPQRLTDEGGASIGYKSDVVFPLRIVPEDAAKPVVLRLKLDYAVCEKLCIPAEAKAELALTTTSGAYAARLAESEATIPKPAMLGAGDPLAIRSVRRDASGPRPRVIVDVAAPAGRSVELFAEGPTPEWALPVPAPISGAPAGLQRFVFDIDGLPTGATIEGATLKLTAVAGAEAIEVAARLD